MKVIRDGSVRRARGSSAAGPPRTRARDPSSSNACASVIRWPSSARSRTSRALIAEPSDFRRLDRSFQTAARAEPVPPERDIASDVSRRNPLTDEAKLGHGIELSGLDRELQERGEALALAIAEPVAKLLEVPRQEARWIAVTPTRLVGEPVRLGPSEPDGADEGLLQLLDALRRRPAAGPDRQHHPPSRVL